MSFRPNPRDYHQDWDEFWEPILNEAFLEALDNDDYWGQEAAQITKAELEQIKKELCDYHDMMENAGSVYYEITGGRMSKPNYTADAVLSVVEEIRQEEQEGREKALEVILDLCLDALNEERGMVDTINRIGLVADNALIGEYPE